MPDYEVPRDQLRSDVCRPGFGVVDGIGGGVAGASGAARLGGAAFQAVIEALTSTAWLGPSSMTMALAAAPYVVWMIATAEQCQGAALAAAGRPMRSRPRGPGWCLLQ